MSGSWLTVMLAALCACAANAQSLHSESARGQLTVTVTVAGSSTVIIGNNGELRVIVANAPAAEIAALVPAMRKNSSSAATRVIESRNLQIFTDFALARFTLPMSSTALPKDVLPWLHSVMHSSRCVRK